MNKDVRKALDEAQAALDKLRKALDADQPRAQSGDDSGGGGGSLPVRP